MAFGVATTTASFLAQKYLTKSARLEGRETAARRNNGVGRRLAERPIEGNFSRAKCSREPSCGFLWRLLADDSIDRALSAMPARGNNPDEKKIILYMADAYD